MLKLPSSRSVLLAVLTVVVAPSVISDSGFLSPGFLSPGFSSGFVSSGMLGIAVAAPDAAAKSDDAPPAQPKAKPVVKSNPASAKTAQTVKTPAKTSAKTSAKTPPDAGTGAPVTGTPAGSSANALDGKEIAVGTPPAGASPLAALKKSNDDLDKLLKKKYPQWSPEAEAQKANVRKLVGGFLDYRELAHRALARHWESLKPAQRQEFVSTLRDLVERSYLKQVTGDPNYNIKYLKEEKTGGEGTVDATLTTVTRGKKVAVALVYKVVYKDRWLVYDVVTDEQSMLENYRAEFNKIINKEGFDALLKRMKKKLEEDKEE